MRSRRVAAGAGARRRARRIDLDKLRWPKESRILPPVLAFAAVLFASSALISAVGPDGAEGRHFQRLQSPGALERAPRTGKVRIAIDWTTEDDQRLLAVSLVIGRKGMPIFRSDLTF